MKILIFVNLSGCFVISSWFSAAVIVYVKHLSLLLLRFVAVFVFYLFRRIYVLSTTAETCLMAFVM